MRAALDRRSLYDPRSWGEAGPDRNDSEYTLAFVGLPCAASSLVLRVGDRLHIVLRLWPVAALPAR